MKKIYWRPQKVSRTVLVFIAVVSLLCMFIVETQLSKVKQPNYAEKIAASRLALQAMEAIKAHRTQDRNWKPDPEADPAESGLIGTLLSPVTTNTGHLPAKQTSVNPNFAAVIVHHLLKAGLKKGDAVAIGVSGSFPALNICAYAAAQTLDLFPIPISSASGSQWGANDPNLLWIDMERILYDRQIFTFRSVAASRGGVEDRALGLPKAGREALDNAVERNGLIVIKPKTYTESVDQRMLLYREYAADKPIKAYINVGGGTTSVGTRVGKKMFKPGLNTQPPHGVRDIDSVMTRFALDGVPIIHLVQVEDLAQMYGLPLMPTSVPRVGEGKVFVKEEYNKLIAAASLVLILALLIGFIRLDWGYRMTGASKREKPPAFPEQMV